MILQTAANGLEDRIRIRLKRDGHRDHTFIVQAILDCQFLTVQLHSPDEICICLVRFRRFFGGIQE